MRFYIIYSSLQFAFAPNCDSYNYSIIKLSTKSCAALFSLSTDVGVEGLVCVELVVVVADDAAVSPVIAELALPDCVVCILLRCASSLCLIISLLVTSSHEFMAPVSVCGSSISSICTEVEFAPAQSFNTFSGVLFVQKLTPRTISRHKRITIKIQNNTFLIFYKKTYKYDIVNYTK